VPDPEMRGRSVSTLNRLVDISDWEPGGELSKVMQELGEGVYVHRKSWEYAICVHGLHQLGCVRPDGVALGVAAGYERPLYYFANHVRSVVATDLYDNPDHEGKPEMLTVPEKFAPFEYRRDHLEVRQMNALELAFDDDTFDFAFCLSSIEHFGDLGSRVRSMQEMHRVLRPGGAVCITTELLLNTTEHPEYFSTQALRECILESTPLSLVGGALDLRISESLLLHPFDVRVAQGLTVSPQIVLTDGDAVWTSVSLFLQKPN
jgi:SAM-dependent methyltransferase